MIETYNTILQEGQDEIVEKKSRFIGYAVPVSSEEEAYAFVEKIRKQHYDARHNCYAFAIGSENTLLRFSDDGEPQGTAGKPILEVITGNAVVNICIVVTRYFGGTLLGTGGLVRAYTEADDTGVVDQNVDVADFLGDLLDHGVDGVLVGNIADIAMGSDASLFVSGQTFINQFLLDIIENDGSAAVCHSGGDSKTDAVRSAGDQGNLAGQIK